MIIFLRLFFINFLLIIFCNNKPLFADSQSLIHPPSSFPSIQQPQREPPPAPFSPKARAILPVMTKPFGMPGVIGYQNNQWEGTDYLGYLSNNIDVNVEILKGDNIANIPDTASLEARVRQILTKEQIVPHSEVTEGPLLPFLHILVIVYPVEKNRYAIFAAARLFEQIQVMRKNFSPAGYWQGITWENQDVILSGGDQLDAQIKSIVDKLTTTFAKRYRTYNITQAILPTNASRSNPNIQPTQNIPPLQSPDLPK